MPADLADLEALPGVGPYTARAVAALAFGVPVGAVDTNVRRVLGRIVAGDAGVLTPGRDAAPGGRGGARRIGPADWTHAADGRRARRCAGRGRRRARRARHGRGVGTPATRGRASAPAHGPTDAPPARRAAPFPTTSRWLRGRILDRLRDARERRMGRRSTPRSGRTTPNRSQRRCDALAMEGLVERDVGQSIVVRARLPLA